MKLKLKQFYPPNRLTSVLPELSQRKYQIKKFGSDIMCMNCNKYIWNKFTLSTFCGKHKTPVVYYEACAYFFPIWSKEI